MTKIEASEQGVAPDSALDAFPHLSIQSQNATTSNISPNQLSKPTPKTHQTPKSRPFTEIQNIAAHATPPTVPSSTRAGPPTNALKRTSPFQFGSRYLEETDDIYAWNAWDHVDPSADTVFVEYAQKQYAFQREHAASPWDRKRFNGEPEKWWDRFYANHQESFFKDRKWLRQEFPVLGRCCRNVDVERCAEAEAAEGAEGEAAPRDSGDANVDAVERRIRGAHRNPDAVDLGLGPWNTVLEIGAGAGNTAFPLLQHNRNTELMVYAVDFSKKAVQLMQESKLFDAKHMVAAQWDMASQELPSGLPPGSVDIVVLVFAFSALSPKQWAQAVRNVYTVLRPGGEVCFRDYGRGDLAQVRFKKDRWLGENFYVRGDGTRVYFFEEDELRRIWSGSVSQVAQEALGKEADYGKEASLDSESIEEEPAPAFEIVSLGTDRRLLVNRQKKLKMYRCWMQGRFRKPVPA